MNQPATTNPESKPVCPVCQSSQCQRLDEFPVTDLCALYQRQLKVDIGKEFPPGLNALLLEQCEACGMQFFHPLLSGSADFYSQLSTQNSYYSETRWEFLQARKLLESSSAVLDVGCGDGFFLSLLSQTNKLGLEFNPKAVAAAQKRGLPVRRGTVAELSEASFDAITVFHVLEHLPEPLPFLRDILRVLKPNGLLVISVPNNDAFIGQDIQHPANAPPHHPLRWCAAPLAYLPKILPLRLESLQREPLSALYAYTYRRTRVTGLIKKLTGGRLPLMKRNFYTNSVRKFANALAFLSLKVRPDSDLHNTSGFSIMAVYRKSDND